MTANLLQGKRGTILVTAMLLMTCLAIIAMATNMNVVTDTGIASNYLSSLQSFYIAEAGLERARTECVERFSKGNWSDYSLILRGVDGVPGTGDDGILSFGPKVSFHGGHYSVKVVNEPGDEGGTGTDTDATISLISKGGYGKSESVLRTTITTNILPPLPGSINLTGCTSAYFGNDDFMIDGRDYLLSDGSVPNGTLPARSGISVSDVASPTTVKEKLIKSLNSVQLDNISGAEPSPSIEISKVLNKTLLKQSVDMLKRFADNRIVEPGTALTTSGPDNSVAIGPFSYSLGTASCPKVTHISKPDGGAISLTGSGVGIIIVEGNNLSFKPAMHFSGAVILLGRNIILDDSGSTTGLHLKGGLIVVELADTPSGHSIAMTGPSRILYSQEAIDQAQRHVMKNKRYRVVSWQRSY